MDDNSIIELYFARNEQAISETKNKYGKYCLKIAYNVLGNREDAEECENDTYIGVWNAIPPTRPQILSAFIGRIARNISLKMLRAKTAEKRQSSEAVISLDELGECIPAPEEGGAEELMGHIKTFLAAAEDIDRKLFVGRYFHAYEVGRMAEALGLSPNAVSLRLHRTREKLRVYLRQRGYTV